MKPETRSFYELAVRRAIERIASQLDGAIELAAVAREAALSPLHFHHVFRGAVGETPLELHRRLRMERAAFQLATTDAPVTTIAFDAGYETHEAFTRAFRAAYGVPPSDFRQLRSQRGASGCARPADIELAARCGVHFVPGAPAVPVARLITGGSAMKVDIVEMPAMRAFTVRHVGPYNRISEAFARLGAVAGAAGLIGRSSAMLALSHDDPETTPADQLRSDAAITVPDDAPLPATLGEARIAAGSYAKTTHVGAYTKLGDTWARLMGEWLPQSGRRVGAGASFEIYRNTPMDTPEDALITELYVPLAPIA